MKLGNSSSKSNWTFFFFLCFLEGETSIVRLTFHNAGKLNLFPEQSGPISPGWGRGRAPLPAASI